MRFVSWKLFLLLATGVLCALPAHAAIEIGREGRASVIIKDVYQWRVPERIARVISERETSTGK